MLKTFASGMLPLFRGSHFCRTRSGFSDCSVAGYIDCMNRPRWLSGIRRDHGIVQGLQEIMKSAVTWSNAFRLLLGV